MITVRKYTAADLPDMIRIWNQVVEDGIAFPQEDLLDTASGAEFFAAQSYNGVAADENGKVCGLYILHPNNVGRCGHICNASYAVDRDMRGLHIGEKLVTDCLAQAKKLGFGVMQFNAVVATNTHARHLYERLGFTQLGVIPKGFRMKDGHYEDICPYYHEL
ncbi:MAG: GNAT family N-acetyltransferase [Oscillospiraceae bacterium]|nr:GNAT family N-acetyltransferase [Oscillospiraceae bacterium]